MSFRLKRVHTLRHAHVLSHMGFKFLHWRGGLVREVPRKGGGLLTGCRIFGLMLQLGDGEVLSLLRLQ